MFTVIRYFEERNNVSQQYHMQQKLVTGKISIQSQYTVIIFHLLNQKFFQLLLIRKMKHICRDKQLIIHSRQGIFYHVHKGLMRSAFLIRARSILPAYIQIHSKGSSIAIISLI